MKLDVEFSSTNDKQDSNILIIGASGFLGSNILLGLEGKQKCWAHSLTRRINLAGTKGIQVDLRTPKSATELLGNLRPSLVVNCAALANIEACEREPELAKRLNADLPAELAKGCRALGAKLVHVSTDAVCDDARDICEVTSIKSPKNVYGYTKASGEDLVLSILPTALVIRTNIIGWSPTGTRSLLEFFLSALVRKQQVNGFHDSLFRPISACNFWPIVSEWLRDEKFGVMHAVGSELISKYEFGCRVAHAFDFNSDVISRTSINESDLGRLRGRSLNLRPSEIRESDLIDIDLALRDLRILSESGYRERLSQI